MQFLNRKLLRELNEDYPLPNRRTVAERWIPKLYEDVLTKVKDKITSFDSYTITFDGWTCSRTQDQYLALTAQAINIQQCKIESFCIGCIPLNEAHTGQNLCSSIEKKIQELNLRKPFFAVTDGASNVRSACEKMKIPRMSCVAHLIHLVLEKYIYPKIFNPTDLIKKVIDKCRTISSSFHRSPKLWSEYSAIYEHEMNKPPKRIPRDCRTRWNSALPMLEEVLCQSEQLHIASIELKNYDLSINSEDERIMSDLFKLLKPFQEATEKLSGSTYITSCHLLGSFLLSGQCGKNCIQKLIYCRNPKT